MWGCQFRKLSRENSELRSFIDSQFPQFFRKHRSGPVTEDQILKAVAKDEFYGFLEVKIRIPDEWPQHLKSSRSVSPKAYFNSVTPLFATCKVTFDQLGNVEQDYIISKGLSQRPRTLLVGGLRADHLCISSELLKFRVDSVQCVQMFGILTCSTFHYCCHQCLSKAETDEGSAALGTVMKLIGVNVSFQRSL